MTAAGLDIATEAVVCQDAASLALVVWRLSRLPLSADLARRIWLAI